MFFEFGVPLAEGSTSALPPTREEVEKLKGELAQTRKDLKGLTKYVIGRIEALIEKYGPVYPRLTKSSRYDEVEAKGEARKRRRRGDPLNQPGGHWERAADT